MLLTGLDCDISSTFDDSCDDHVAGLGVAVVAVVVAVAGAWSTSGRWVAAVPSEEGVAVGILIGTDLLPPFLSLM